MALWKPFGKCSFPEGCALPNILTSCSNLFPIYILIILLERVNLNRSVVKVAQNVTDLEQRVEVLEVEVANIEDDINDTETDLDLQTNRIDNVEDDVSENTNTIIGNRWWTFLRIVYKVCVCVCVCVMFCPPVVYINI